MHHYGLVIALGLYYKCMFQAGVTGPRCDQCAAGRFNLDANNPDGCSECWCNDLSDTCDSGNKYW